MAENFYEMTSGNPERSKPERLYTDEERWHIGEKQAACAAVDAGRPDLIRDAAEKLRAEIGAPSPEQPFSPKSMPDSYFLESGRYESLLKSIDDEKQRIGRADHMSLAGIRELEDATKRLLEYADMQEHLSRVVEVEKAGVDAGNRQEANPLFADDVPSLREEAEKLEKAAKEVRTYNEVEVSDKVE
ncbi:MAG: hypothetical protein HGA31_04750 [Candidatus Moranbacteria bacterium]|nr:hypothetical protein [Candidatus Moranbacteria bacterium]